MIRSMTGYGRAVRAFPDMTVTVELKSVNHRFFEFNARVPRAYSFIEDKLKSFLRANISRGKLDCFVQIEAEEAADSGVTLNTVLADGYYAATRALCERYDLKMPENVDFLIAHPDIFNVKKQPADEDQIWENVRLAAEDALNAFTQMRETEGEKLQADVFSCADRIAAHLAFVEERSPETVKEYNTKLLERMRELLGDAQVDEQRLLTEAAIFADKVAVAEETVRLHSHLSQLRRMFDSREPIGRNLDFLVQEINRETNTIGSKASDLEIAKRVIAMKGEIEKIREQIQNIE